MDHKGSFDAGAEDEFGLVWTCDVDCPHPEHDDDPDDNDEPEPNPGLTLTDACKQRILACQSTLYGQAYNTADSLDKASEWLAGEIEAVLEIQANALAEVFGGMLDAAINGYGEGDPRLPESPLGM